MAGILDTVDQRTRLVEIIDVEKVLAEIVPFNARVSEGLRHR
jgi:hypothetical protein